MTPIKTALAYFAEMGKLMLKFYENPKGSRTPKQSWKWTKLEDLYFLFSNLLQVMVIKTVWYWHKAGQID